MFLSLTGGCGRSVGEYEQRKEFSALELTHGESIYLNNDISIIKCTHLLNLSGGLGQSVREYGQWTKFSALDLTHGNSMYSYTIKHLHVLQNVHTLFSRSGRLGPSVGEYEQWKQISTLDLAHGESI